MTVTVTVKADTLPTHVLVGDDADVQPDFNVVVDPGSSAEFQLSASLFMVITEEEPE